MAPKKQAKSEILQTAPDEGRSESTSFDASQSQDRQAADLQEVMRKNRQKTQLRREQQKKEILAKHETRQTKLKQDIAQCLETHDEKVRAIRRPQLERLLDLAHQKSALEDRIEARHSELDQMFLTTANQLQIVLSGRIEDLTE